MILKLIFITILSTTIHAEDLTGKYMIEDSLHEFSKINKFQENNFCGTQEQVGDEKITPIKMEMPKLLTAEFFKLKEICEDSKKNHQEKKIAFLMFKTHMCDRGSKACLYNTRTMVDPCNKFLQDNFSIYHTRMFRYKTLKSPSEEMPKQQEMFDEWEKYGIEGGGMVLIDVEKCKVIDKNRQPEEIKNADPDARIESMKKNILIGLKENGFDPKELKQDAKCTKEERDKYPEPTLDDIHQSLEEQTVKLLE